MSRAGGLPGVGGVGLGGQDVSGGRNFGVVSGEAVINQNMQGMPNQGMPPGMMPDIMGQIAPNLPGMPPANTGLPPLNPGMPPSNVTPLPGQAPPNIGGSRGDMPPAAKGPSLASGVGPNTQLGDLGNQVGGTAVSNNPSLSPTDAMVNRIAEAERAVKNERRSQWLQMNQQSAANVLSSIGGELPSHLKGQDENSAAEFLANAIGSGKDESANDALFKRMAEVAVRRVARKRGVAVDTPQTRTENGVLIVNVTYIDDGRVLDTPEDLSAAFEHAISTEVALKGLDAIVDINLFRSKDGAVDKIGSDGSAPEAEESDEEMFACEVCDGLVKESDNECPHCGAIFEEEDDEPVGAPPAREVVLRVHQEAVLRVLPEVEALQVLSEAARQVAVRVVLQRAAVLRVLSEVALLVVAQVVLQRAAVLQRAVALQALSEAALLVAVRVVLQRAVALQVLSEAVLLVVVRVVLQRAVALQVLSEAAHQVLSVDHLSDTIFQIDS